MIEVKEVRSHRDMRRFVRFPFRLYRSERNWCPPLVGDEFDTFNPRKNGALRFCEHQCFLAYMDGQIVGRIAAIINRRSDEKSGERCLRFGWLDCIDSPAVCSALMAAAEKWGAKRSCTVMRGPLGFTDMDKQGLLVDGFEHPSPFTCLYNYPYYDDLVTSAGFAKEKDWVQRSVNIKPQLPQMYSFAGIIEQRYGLHMADAKSTRELAEKYGMDVFRAYNEAFSNIYGSSQLDEDQIRKYIRTYVPIMNKDYLAVCLDAEDRPVGFAFCVPSLNQAIRKARGRLVPFGFVHVLRALKKNDSVEALLIGVLPEYQGKGASVLVMKKIHESCLKNGIHRMIINPQLEDNTKALSLFDQYDAEFYMRRRAYVKQISI